MKIILYCYGHHRVGACIASQITFHRSCGLRSRVARWKNAPLDALDSLRENIIRGHGVR